MKCPVCGSKMVDGKICKYCNITSEQVFQASNKEAKKLIKQHNKQKVCYTTNIPKDVNKLTLVLLTICLGMFGAGDFYVGKYFKGLYCLVSFSLGIIFSILNFIGITALIVVWGFQISVYLMMVNMFFWFSDIMGFILKLYKVPVVLPETTVSYNHHSIKK